MKNTEVEYMLKRLAPELDIRVTASAHADVFNIRWVAVAYADFNPAPHNAKANADTLRRLTKNAQREMFPEAEQLAELKTQVAALKHENQVLRSLIEGRMDAPRTPEAA